ncbi:MAG: hypothetical protein M0P71_01455 [Melioribacteraceae bacterium]|nr:hypothetical protein [Melioribacteraceae bacterium]
MAKIVITIDGEDASLTIDGAKIKNLKSVNVYYYEYESCGRDLCFNYSINNKDKDGFSSVTNFSYQPSTASFIEGKPEANVKEPTLRDFAKI